MKIDFISRLKSLRIKKNINQRTLAEEIKVSQKQISMYENGSANPTLQVLINLADFFKVSLDYLCGRIFVPEVTDINSLQVQLNRRSLLFTQPDGEFDFTYFNKGTKKKSIFKYSFGLLPLQHVDFMPTFLVVHEASGSFLELITGYSRLKAPDQMSDSHFHQIRANFCSDDNLPFLAFTNHLNSTLSLGYRLDKEPNGMHRVQLITTIPSAVPSVPYYAEIVSGSGKPVSLKEILYAEFLNKQYLPLSNEEKAKFLAPYTDEAFKW